MEARAYGQGKSYGTKVDCWSLGAVLYVMLVARFPEFDRTQGLMRVKLDSPLWNTVSEAAKDLIRCLMTPDPDARFSIKQVRSTYASLAASSLAYRTAVLTAARALVACFSVA